MQLRGEWDRIGQALRVATRSLRLVPGFALPVVATLALGLGAVTAVLSVVYGVLLRPLPYPAADQRVTVDTRYATSEIDRGDDDAEVLGHLAPGAIEGALDPVLTVNELRAGHRVVPLGGAVPPNHAFARGRRQSGGWPRSACSA
jgi:hypothetical protein